MTSVEAWEEFKDKLWWNEKVPEEDYDELNGCVAKCWLKDQMDDLKGVAYEELKEDANAKYDKSCDSGVCDESLLRIKQIPCQRCIRYIPMVTHLQNSDFGNLEVDSVIDKINTVNNIKNGIKDFKDNILGK